MTQAELDELALRCARREVPVYALVEALSRNSALDKAEILFGPCVDRGNARVHLKTAHMAATRADH